MSGYMREIAKLGKALGWVAIISLIALGVVVSVLFINIVLLQGSKY